MVRLNEKDRRSFQRSFREKMNLFNTSRDRAESEVISVSRGGNGIPQDFLLDLQIFFY